MLNTAHDSLIAFKDDGITEQHVFDAVLKRMVDSERYGAWLVWDAQDLAGKQSTNSPELAVYWHQNGMEMHRDIVPSEILSSNLYRVPRIEGQSFLLEPHYIDAIAGDPTRCDVHVRPLEHNGKIVGALASMSE